MENPPSPPERHRLVPLRHSQQLSRIRKAVTFSEK